MTKFSQFFSAVGTHNLSSIKLNLIQRNNWKARNVRNKPLVEVLHQDAAIYHCKKQICSVERFDTNYQQMDIIGQFRVNSNSGSSKQPPNFDPSRRRTYIRVCFCWITLNNEDFRDFRTLSTRVIISAFKYRAGGERMQL